MALDVNKEQLTINKLICEKKEIITVQGDMIVPDSKPDIINTIDTSGIVSIYKKEVIDGKVRIDGNINVYIMYLSDSSDDKIRGINTNLDFTENFIIPQCLKTMNTIVTPKVKNIECNVLNGRKINIQIELETQIKVFEKSDLDIISNIECDNICVLKPTCNINSLVGIGNNKALVKDNIKINNADSLAEILKANVNLTNKDIKISYNKVLVKTEAEVCILYLTEEGIINMVTSKLPIVGFIDIQGISEDDICDENFEIKNIIIKPNGIEEHSIYVEIEVDITCQAYKNRNIEIMEDVYSTSNQIIYDKDTINMISNNNNRNEMLNIRETINIPEISNGKIINVEVDPIITNINKANSKLMYEGDVKLNIIYTNDIEAGVNMKNVAIPFEFMTEPIEEIEKMEIDTIIETINKDFVIKPGGEVDVNLDLNFDINMFEDRSIDVISNITEEEYNDNQDYSVIIYRVKKGDTLWKIAKEFRSTIDDIARINGIENVNVINEGEKLYIPKISKVVM